MRILITIDVYKNVLNGIVTSTNNLIDGLEKAGHEVRIIALSDSWKSEWDGNKYYLGSMSVGFIYPNMRVKIKSMKKIMKEIVLWKPDIIHSQTEFSGFYVARKVAKKLNIPIIHTYHTLYENYTHYFSPSKKIGAKVIKWYSKLICNKAKTIIAPTNKVKNILLGYGVKSQIKVIPTGIDLSHFENKPSEKIKDKLRKDLGINKKDFIMVYVGRLGDEKNISELIEGINYLKNEGVSLLIVGDGPARNKLQDQVERLDLKGKVVFTGMIPYADLVKYFYLGDVFVSASTSETQGLTYVEGLAASLPLVCRYDACLDGLVINNENGFLYNTISEFVEYIKYLKENRKICEKMGIVSKKIADDCFSIESFINNIIRCYEE